MFVQNMATLAVAMMVAMEVSRELLRTFMTWNIDSMV